MEYAVVDTAEEDTGLVAMYFVEFLFAMLRMERSWEVDHKGEGVCVSQKLVSSGRKTHLVTLPRSTVIGHVQSAANH